LEQSNFASNISLPFLFPQDEDTSVRNFLSLENIADTFHLPLSLEPLQQHQEIQQVTQIMNYA
jgi:hypothetical protein